MPESQAGAVPSFVGALQGLTDEKRLAALQRTHPDFTASHDSWQVLLDAFEGSGGFADGGYLWPYPRETESDFAKRQKRARYHNYLEALIDLYIRFLFTQGVKRKSSSTEYDEWLQDVDGAGTSINDFLKRSLAQGLSAGHTGVLVDKTDEEAAGPTKADELARPIARLFPPTTIVDWRFSGPTLVAVKLHESAPEGGITEPLAEGDEAVQYLLWDEEGWARFNHKGELIAAGVPQLGLVPLAILRPKPRYAHAVFGRALISNPNIPRALYNRDSEEDNVLRDQAFSMLTVSVPTDGNVDQTKEDLGSEVGTTRALVVKGVVDYKTPSQEVPATIRENRAYLVREMYRAAHVRYQRDGLDAESGESIRLQFSDLNEMLQGTAKALIDTEKRMARAYFAWQTPTVEAGEAAYNAAAIEIEYPNEFFNDDLLSELTALAEAIRMDLGPTMTKRIKKKAVRRVDPEMPPEDLDTIDAEIDGQDEDRLRGNVMPFPLDTGRNPFGETDEESPDAA